MKVDVPQARAMPLAICWIDANEEVSEVETPAHPLKKVKESKAEVPTKDKPPTGDASTEDDKRTSAREKSAKPPAPFVPPQFECMAELRQCFLRLSAADSPVGFSIS